MKLSKEEKEWIKKCKKNPDKYRIMVDNDCLFIVDNDEQESIFSFDYYGYDFIIQLLNYMKINAEYV